MRAYPGKPSTDGIHECRLCLWAYYNTVSCRASKHPAPAIIRTKTGQIGDLINLPRLAPVKAYYRSLPEYRVERTHHPGEPCWDPDHGVVGSSLAT
jgi:hypothetical protein